MYRRLVQNVRTGFPDLLGRPFEVAELYTTLIPYRHNRRELELDTNQDYEHALLRLLSGERGYLIGDPQMQTDLRSELDSPNPDLTKFRAYSTTMVSIAPDGARTVDPPVLRRPGSGGTAAIPSAAAPPPPAAPAAAPPPASAPPTAARAAMADRPTLGVPGDAAPAPRAAAPPRRRRQPHQPHQRHPHQRHPLLSPPRKQRWQRRASARSSQRETAATAAASCPKAATSRSARIAGRTSRS